MKFLRQPQQIVILGLLLVLLSPAIGLAVTSTAFKLTDVVLDIPSMIIGVGLIGAIWKGGNAIVDITNKLRDIKEDLTKADDATRQKLDHLNYVASESFRRSEVENQMFKAQMKDYEMELKDLRNQLLSMQGYLAKHGYAIRGSDR